MSEMHTASIAPVALVTGAARRIGAAISSQLHAAGYNVVIHYRNSATDARQLCARFNAERSDSATALSADLLDTAGLPALVDQAVACWGRLDALVNNASSFYPTPVDALDEAAWDDLVGTNFKAPLFLTRAAIPALREHAGAVVNLVDPHRQRPLPGYAPYVAAKAALSMLTRSLALELAPEIRVNAVAPGTILWPEHAAPDAAWRARRLQAIPLQRMGEVDEVARVVRFLLGPEAAYITGQIIDVDGGYGLSGPAD